MSLSNKQRSLLAIGILANIIMCGYFLYHWRLGYNSDVAMIGLMAKNFMVTGELPIFVWTVGYQGMLLDVPVTAFFFKLFGVSPLALSLTPAFFLILMYSTCFYILSSCFGRNCALLALIFMAFSSPQYYLHFLRTLPNYPEANFGGMLGIAVFMMIIRKIGLTGKEPDNPGKLIFTLGVVQGFFYYLFVLSAYYALAMVVQIAGLIVAFDLKTQQKKLSLTSRTILIRKIFPFLNADTLLKKVGFTALSLVSWALLIKCLLVFFQWDTHPIRWLSSPVQGILLSLILLIAYPVLSSLREQWQKSLIFLSIYGLGFFIGHFPQKYFIWFLNGKVNRSAAIGGYWNNIYRRAGIFFEFQKVSFLTTLPGFESLAYLSATIILLSSAVFLVVMLLKFYRHCRIVDDNFDLSGKISLVFFFFPIVIFAIFCTSPLIQDINHGRWSTPLFLWYSIATAFVFVGFWSRFPNNRLVKSMLIMGGLIICTHNTIAMKSYVDTIEQREQDYQLIINEMDKNNLKAGYATYWVAYATNLIVDERLILRPIEINYSPKYSKSTDPYNEIGWVVALGGQAGKEVGDIVDFDGSSFLIKSKKQLEKRYDFALLERLAGKK